MSLRNHATVWIGGAAGDGVASTGDIFARTCSRSGLHLFAYNSYQSVIRGGHVLYQIHVSSEPVFSQGSGKYDLMIALNQDCIDLHRDSVYPAEARGIIYSTDRVKVEGTLPAGARAYGLPVTELTKEFGRNPVMQNTVALGTTIFLLGLEWDVFENAVRGQFGKKKAEIADMNVKMARKGWEYAKENFKPMADVSLKGDGRKRALMTGNQSIALGALAGGCRFYSAYPMTPASSIMHWLAPRASKYGFVMKQCEDEIAAICMAIGAGFTGVRSMTGTSGGGFSLMTEAVGLAGMTETPVVIAMVQRGGPSTGLPTKTEQADLFQVINASQGEFPKAVIAPLSVEDAYYATTEALNLADKYQLPVVVLSDLLLSEHMETVEPDRLSNRVPIDRGELVTEPNGHERYLRYKDTPSGVSPRALPGLEGATHIAASDEHDEAGIIISDIYTNPTTRVKMVKKRFRKMDGVLKDTKPFLKEGPDTADLTLVGWGSTYKILQEVRRALEKAGMKVNHLQFRALWPFHSEAARREFEKAKKVVCVENNYSGQFARLVRQETGFAFQYHVRKYDGEPFYLGPLLEKLKAVAAAGSPTVESIVTSELDIPVKRVEVTAAS